MFSNSHSPLSSIKHSTEQWSTVRRRSCINRVYNKCCCFGAFQRSESCVQVSGSPAVYVKHALILTPTESTLLYVHHLMTKGEYIRHTILPLQLMPHPCEIETHFAPRNYSPFRRRRIYAQQLAMHWFNTFLIRTYSFGAWNVNFSCCLQSSLWFSVTAVITVFCH